MESTVQLPKAVRFGPFEAYCGDEKLLKNGIRVRLQDQPLKLLLLLLARPGEIVSREEMRARLWPADSFGDFDNGLNVAIKKLRTALGDDSDRPQYVETVPRRGYRFIGTVTEVDYAAGTRDGLLPALSSSEAVSLVPSATQPGASRNPFRKNGPTLLAVIALLLGGLLVTVILVEHRTAARNPDAVTHSGAVRRSVAVLGFRNSSGRAEDAWLSTALSEMFSTELAAGDHLRLISGEDMSHLRLAQSTEEVDSVSPGTARRLRKTLNADLIVSGSYAAVGGSEARLVRLDVRLQDAVSGEILTEVSDSATEDALFQIVGNVGERLRRKLGISGISEEQHAQVLASMPSNRAAGEYYSKGLLKLRTYDALTARDLFQQSIALEPSFPLAHSALSEAWSRLGYDRRALDEARRASQLSSSLLPTDRLRVQARYWQATRDWDKAAQAYRSLQSSFPDDPEYGILLADCLSAAGKGKEAIGMLDSLRGQPSSLPYEAQIDLAIADASSVTGDLDRASSASDAAVAEGRSRGQSMLLARALRTQGLVLENLSQYDKAIASTEESRRIYEATGDRFGVASDLEVQGNILSDRSDLPGALGKYGLELSIVREAGNKRGAASALNNMALVLYQQGDLERARSMWEEAEAAFRELGDKSNTSVVLVNIGGTLKDQGDLASAKLRYVRALALSRDVHDAGGTVLALNALGTVSDAEGNFIAARKTLAEASAIDLANGHATASSESLIDLGDVLRHQGDLMAARRYYGDALTASQQRGEKSWSAFALFGLGKLALLNADFSSARGNYDQSLQIRKDLGEIFTVAETEMAIVEVSMAEGVGGDPTAQLTKLRETFRKANKRDDVIAATTLLIRTKMAEGKTDEALRELATVQTPGRIQDVETRMTLGIARGQLQAATGKLPEARTTLETVLHEAERAGSPEYVFECRLALLDTETASAQKTAKLARLSRQATDAGFRLVPAQIKSRGR